MAANVTKTNNQSWYSIKAKANDTAEISIYDEIGFWGVSAASFAQDLKDCGNNIKQINLHIHSPGGDVFDGIAIYNLLKNHPANVTVYIDGLAASMASVIAMAGNEVIMPENAMMMIHKPWGIQGGDAEDMRKYADLLDKVENTLIPAYANKTGKTPEELAEMLSAETWLNGKECVEQGFADKLAEPLVAMASIKSRKLEDFENMPKAMKDMLFKPQGNAGASAPQATLMTTISQGIFTNKLEWTYILTGVVLGAVLITIDAFLKKVSNKVFGLPVIAVGIGIYLPPSINMPVIVGAFLAWIMTRHIAKLGNKEVSAKAERFGTLFSAGLIVGESLMGVILAFIIAASVTTGGSEAPLSLNLENWDTIGEWLGLIVFIVGIVIFASRVLRAKKSD